MAGIWYRTGTVAVTSGSKTVTGTNTQWQNLIFGVAPGVTFYGPDGKPYEIDTVNSNTSLTLVTNYSGSTASGQAYAIDPTRSGSVASLAAQTSEVLKFSQKQFTQIQTWFTGAANANVTLESPAGQTITVPSYLKVTSEGEGQAARAKVEADRAKTEADRAANATAEADRAKTEADRAANATAEADRAAAAAKVEADRAKTEADRAANATTEADRAKTEADRAKTEADRAKTEADLAKTEADLAKTEADLAKTEADLAKTEADRAKTEADRAAAAANATAEAGTGSLMRVGGATILDAERYALERATGGKQTIIYDAAGNANAMFVLPRFSYADLGMTADMGTGDVTAFDFGSGSIKGEIFIGAYLASGSGAVSAPRQDPRASLDHTAARNACSAKGAGWHLMTAHEWAAIALWCMANGYEPIGNTNWGRSHAQTRMVGDRADNRAPGDASGTGRTQTGSMGSEATHTRTLGGIADLVGNVWEWQDGMLLQDGRIKISAYNTQAEVDWAFADAFLDASTPTGGSAILSNAVNIRMGAIGDNADAGNTANAEWRAMTKSGSYVSNQAMKRLLLEPAGALPQGRIYMRNFGERLPFRGGSWYGVADAGLAALNLSLSRAHAYSDFGFRSAFA